MSQRISVVVVGAGVGGVAIAARLSKAGLDVTVLEKNAFAGGRCSLLHHEGYRFDQGPSLLLLPQIFRTTFADLGTSLEEQDVHLLKCEPNYVVHFHDGKSIKLSTDLSSMRDELEKWGGSGVFSRYLKFLGESHKHYELSVTHVLNRNFTSLFSMLRPSFLRHLFTLHPFDSVYTRASKYFFTDRLRRAFTFGSMYMGMSPFESPGTYSLLQYAELAQGIWYPRGGFHKVIEALVKISESRSVKFRLLTSVVEVLVSTDSKVTGVKLASGECVQADIVVLNSDLVYSYRHLLPPSEPGLRDHLMSLVPVLSRLIPPTTTSLTARKPSCSSLSFYWSMDRIIPQLSAHNVFLAEEFEGSFDQIFKLREMPTQPSFYVNVPSRIDASAAPEGKDAVVILVPVGCLPQNTEDSQDFDKMVAHARRIVLQTLEKRLGLAGVQDWIVHEMVNTPLDWRAKFNLDRGAILGLAHDFLNVLSFRPRTRHSSVDGLFFVGASTHPGTGVPICLSGAKIVSEQVLSDLDIPAPWAVGPGQMDPHSQQCLGIDQARPPPFFTTARAILLFISSALAAWALTLC